MSLSGWIILIVVLSPVWFYVVTRLVSRAIKRTIEERRKD